VLPWEFNNVCIVELHVTVNNTHLLSVPTEMQQWVQSWTTCYCQ